MPQSREDRDVQEVVRAHAGWVFACAKRRVRDEALAEDVAQAVFVLLWQKGARLGGEVRVTGWLYRAVRHCAGNALRLKQIRQRHEREAAMAALADGSAGEVDWGEVSPELEWAVDRLGEKYRSAVLLRFYRQMSFAEVGQSLGISEKAATKRVERAVEKLRGVLAKKGVVAGAAALGVVMAEKVTAAAPAGLVEAAMAAAGGGGPGSAGVIVKGAIKMMAWAKVRVAAAILLVVVPIGTAGWHVWAQTPASLPATKQTVFAAPAAGGLRLPAADRDVLAARLRALENVRVECDMTNDYGPPQPGDPPANKPLRGVGFVPYTGVRHTSETFCRLGDRTRSEVFYGKDVIEWDRSRGTRPMLESVRTVSDNRQEAYSLDEGAEGPGSTRRSGTIQDRPSRLDQACLMEHGLGLRADDQNGWITEQRLNQMAYERVGDDKIVLRETNAVGRIHEWEFSRALGLAMVAYRAHMPDEKWVVEIIPSDFRNVGGVMLPFSIVRRHVDKREGPAKEVLRWEATVKQCKVNDPANTPDQYLIKWPEGTTVNDTRRDVVFEIGAGGKVLTEEEISRATAQHPGKHRIVMEGEQ